MSHTARGRRRLGRGWLLAVLVPLALSGCGKAPTAHEAMRDCYVQLDKQAPAWRKEARSRTSKIGLLVPRYIGECMQAQRFKLAARCTTTDERCYTREPRFWERL